MKIRTIAAPVALAGVMVLAGCGSSSESAATGSNGGPGGGGFQQALTDYVACLKDNGVTVTLPSGGPGGGQRPSGAPTGMPDGAAPPSGAPSGGPGGGFLTKPDGVSQATWDTAQKACASVLPQGPGGAGGPAPSAYPTA